MLGIYVCHAYAQGNEFKKYALAFGNGHALSKLAKWKHKLLHKYGRISGYVTRLELNL